jgi:hypothetical protein
VSFRLYLLSLFNKIDLNCYVFLSLSNNKLLFKHSLTLMIFPSCTPMFIMYTTGWGRGHLKLCHFHTSLQVNSKLKILLYFSIPCSSTLANILHPLPPPYSLKQKYDSIKAYSYIKRLLRLPKVLTSCNHNYTTNTPSITEHTARLVRRGKILRAYVVAYSHSD